MYGSRGVGRFWQIFGRKNARLLAVSDSFLDRFSLIFLQRGVLTALSMLFLNCTIPGDVFQAMTCCVWPSGREVMPISSAQNAPRTAPPRTRIPDLRGSGKRTPLRGHSSVALAKVLETFLQPMQMKETTIIRCIRVRVAG